MVFRYAIATGRAERDISQDLRDALTTPQVKHRAAITEPKKVGELLRAIDGYTGQPTTRLALQLAALVFVRPGELRHARWQEFDLSEAVWTIPAETMKMNRPHRVPLARQTIAIIRELHKITGAGRIPVSGDHLRPPADERKHAQCGSPPPRLRKEEVSVHGFSARPPRPCSTRWAAGIRMRSSGSWRTRRRTTSETPTCTRRSFGTSVSR